MALPASQVLEGPSTRRTPVSRARCEPFVCCLCSCAGAAGPGQGSEGRHPPAPAIVTEYMAAGSLRVALSRKADWLSSGMAKVKVMLDAARVRVVGLGISCTHVT